MKIHADTDHKQNKATAKPHLCVLRLSKSKKAVTYTETLPEHEGWNKMASLLKGFSKKH